MFSKAAYLAKTQSCESTNVVLPFNLDIIKFEMEANNLPFMDAVEKLAEKAGLQVPRDSYVRQEDVEKKKPNPEGFLKAMDYFQILKSDTIIFEDSDVGVEAAEKSGANVFVVKGYS